MSAFNEGHLTEVTIDNDVFLVIIAHGRQKCGEILQIKRVNVGDVMTID